MDLVRFAMRKLIFSLSEGQGKMTWFLATQFCSHSKLINLGFVIRLLFYIFGLGVNIIGFFLSIPMFDSPI